MTTAQQDRITEALQKIKEDICDEFDEMVDEGVEERLDNFIDIQEFADLESQLKEANDKLKKLSSKYKNLLIKIIDNQPQAVLKKIAGEIYSELIRSEC